MPNTALATFINLKELNIESTQTTSMKRGTFDGMIALEAIAIKNNWGPVLLMSGFRGQTALCTHTARLSPYTP